MGAPPTYPGANAGDFSGATMLRVPPRFRALVEGLPWEIVVSVIYDMALRLIGGGSRDGEEAVAELRRTVRHVRGKR